MRKSVLALFCSLLLATSIWGARSPKNSISWLFGTNPELNPWRIGAAVVLLAFGFVPLLEESLLARSALLATALTLAMLFLQNQLLIPPTHPEHIRFMPLDMVQAVEVLVAAGIVAMAPSEDELSDEIAAIHARRESKPPQPLDPPRLVPQGT